MNEDYHRMNRVRRFAVYGLVVFFALVLAVAVFVNAKNTQELSELLEDSVKAQLISVSVSARSLIDAEEFDSYNSAADVEGNVDYDVTLARLRALCDNVGAE